MYRFSDEMVMNALEWWTRVSCGEFDEDFYYQASAETFVDAALEACIVMDFIDDLSKDIYKENFLTPKCLNQYKGSLDGGDTVGSEGIKR
jgi:hypothetical protein